MWKDTDDMKKDNAQLKAYMSEDTFFKGLLSFEGTVRIDGKFEGQVITKDTLIIGEKGHVEGTVMASKKVEIHSTSRVLGKIKSPALYIELGGVLDGTCDMTGKESKVVPLVKTEEKNPSTNLKKNNHKN